MKLYNVIHENKILCRLASDLEEADILKELRSTDRMSKATIQELTQLTKGFVELGFINKQNGKIKKLTKQRDYYKTKFEELNNAMLCVPETLNMLIDLCGEMSTLKKSLREKDALIAQLDKE